MALTGGRETRMQAPLPTEGLAAVDEGALRRRLGSWACRHGVPSADFEDVCQEAWAKLLTTERRGDPVRNLEHGLRWNVSNAWKEEARRRTRRPTVELDSFASSALLACPDADPYQQLERLETARGLLEAVNALSERQRQIVLLADVCDHSPAEVRARLNLSERTYRREHASALGLIAAHLGDLLAEHSSVSAACAEAVPVAA